MSLTPQELRKLAHAAEGWGHEWIDSPSSMLREGAEEWFAVAKKANDEAIRLERDAQENASRGECNTNPCSCGVTCVACQKDPCDCHTVATYTDAQGKVHEHKVRFMDGLTPEALAKAAVSSPAHGPVCNYPSCGCEQEWRETGVKNCAQQDFRP